MRIVFSCLLLFLVIACSPPARAQSRAAAVGLHTEGQRLLNAGKYSEAEAVLKRAVTSVEGLVGRDDIAVAEVLMDLSNVYYYLGRYAECEAVQKRVLEIRRSKQGENHPAYGASLMNLANTYFGQGKYADAIELHKRALVIRERALGPTHPDLVYSLRNLASVYLTEGRIAESETYLLRALAIAERPGGGALLGYLLLDLGEGMFRSARYAESESTLKRSLTALEKSPGPKHPHLIVPLNALGNLYTELGRFAEAENLFRRALVIAENSLGREHPSTAVVLNNLAVFYLGQERYADAEPLLLRALAAKEKTEGKAHSSYAISAMNLGNAYDGLDRYREAEERFQEALAILQQAVGPESRDVSKVLNNLAVVYAKQGRYDEAERLHAQDLAIKEKVLGEQHPLIADSLNSQAGTFAREGKWEAAVESSRRSSSILRARAERLVIDSETISKSKKTAEFVRFVRAAHIYSKSGHDTANLAREAFEAAQFSQAPQAGRSVAQMAARAAASSSVLGSVVRERQDLVAEYEAKDKQLLALKTSAQRKPDLEKSLSDRLSAIESRLSAIDRRLAYEFPEYAALAKPTAASVKEVQEILKEDEALVFFLDTGDDLKPLAEETLVWVITRDGVQWTASSLGSKALEREVSALRCGLDQTAWTVAGSACASLTGASYSKEDANSDKPPPFDPQRAYTLYRGLFADIEQTVKGKHLLVVPSGALTKLPLQILVTQAPTSPDMRTVQWLAREHAVTILPSVASLYALRRIAKPSTAMRPMIGFGNPLLSGSGNLLLATAARERQQCGPTSATLVGALRGRIARTVAPSLATNGGVVASADLRNFAPLPETADELCAVARDLGAGDQDLYLGSRATESELKALDKQGALAQYRLLHFATHAAVAGALNTTSEPGLVLTPPQKASAEDDGYLTASEVASLKLDADWVVLSACNTAAGGATDAEALSGLARAFLYAGARSLLVSHWEVDSAATVKLITGSIGLISKEKSLGLAEALRRAMVDMIEHGSAGEAHPALWAPFVVVGHG